MGHFDNACVSSEGNLVSGPQYGADENLRHMIASVDPHTSDWCAAHRAHLFAWAAKRTDSTR